VNDREMKVENSVLIVGAGPTGLTLALWLRQFNIPLRIIDKSVGPGETSRAMGVQARTLEFYQQLNLAQEMIERGIKVNAFNLRKDGNLLFTAQLGEMGKGLSPYPFMLSFPQDDHEKFLLMQLLKVGVTVERKKELVSFTQTGTSVQANLSTENGTETIDAAYLCGCDGARSSTREGLKMGFPGGTYSQIFYVADAMVTGDAANGDVQMCLSEKDFCLVMPVRSSGSFRLIGIVPPEQENQEKITFDDVSASIVHDSRLTIEKVNWFSTYHVHHRVAEHFRSDRVFLAGDAAHIHSPVGAQGMNTGIGDAVNLAWKLAAVMQKRAAKNLLDTYEIERQAFAFQLVSTTDKLFQMMTNRGILGKIWRGLAVPFLLPLLFKSEKIKRGMFKRISQIQIAYRQSPLSKGAVKKIHGGDRLPWVPDNFLALRLLDWQVYVYGNVESDFEIALKKMHIKLSVFVWDDNARAAGLVEGAVYLVRPDGYVAFVSENQDGEGLGEFILRFGISSRK
jgi:2-polyprenyl-6-methoxyphenol hydroxylase-like FAD-dependent oxidoreductase